MKKLEAGPEISTLNIEALQNAIKLARMEDLDLAMESGILDCTIPLSEIGKQSLKRVFKEHYPDAVEMYGEQSPDPDRLAA